MLTRFLAVVLLALIQLSCSAPGRGEPSRSVELVDLSVEVGGTVYAGKAVINAAAERGGPALVFLHGSGECGVDGEKMLTVGLPKHAIEDPELWPFVVIVPQKPTVDSEWEDHEGAVLAMLDKAEDLGLIDPDRVGITGLSQGGHGTVALASRHPERFVAAAPVCAYVGRAWDEDGERTAWGGVDETSPAVVDAARALSAMPVWLHHGDSDVVVPVAESRALSGALKALGADVRYSEYEGVNHDSWDHAYTDDAFAAWFRETLGG